MSEVDSAQPCVLFDLDGTVIDSGAAIMSALSVAFSESSLPVPPQSVLRAHVGPPLLDSFIGLDGLSATEADAMVAKYREVYNRTGAPEAPLYPGMRSAILQLAETCTLAIATSKEERTARSIIDRLELAPSFSIVCGASADGVRAAKAAVIAETLRRLLELGADIVGAVMIGDREHDVVGATACGLDTVAVAWGYGAEEEFVNAVAVARRPDELTRIVLSLL